MLDLASHQVTTLPESAGKFSPSWSPDGQFIKADSLDIHSLYLFDVKTQRWSTLYTGSTFAYATWSKDCRFLYSCGTQVTPRSFESRLLAAKRRWLSD